METNLPEPKLLPHDPKHMMTKMTGVDAVKGEAPEWDRFLDFITEGDEEFKSYLLHLCGYWLTGDTRIQQIWFLTGRGRNGKSTFLSLLRYIWKDYAVNAPPGLLVHHPYERHPTELAGLNGVRLAILSEMNPGDKLDVAKMKYVTGEETITARFMHGDFFEFKRQFKLVCACNDLPQIAGGGGIAERRRIVIVPFTPVVPEEDVDLNLLDKLKAEAPAILYRFVQHAMLAVKNGLPRCARVEEETSYYWSEEDHVPEFVAMACTPDNTARISVKELCDLYSSWIFENRKKDEGVTKNALGKAVAALGYVQVKGTAGTRYWKGLRAATGEERHAKTKARLTARLAEEQ